MVEAGTDVGTAGPVVLHGLDGLRERSGQQLGTSSWVTVEQRDIDTFADVKDLGSSDAGSAGASPGGGAEVVYHLTYEVEGEPKPCCVADLVFRYYA